jgi:hypothetical protein
MVQDLSTDPNAMLIEEARKIQRRVRRQRWAITLALVVVIAAVTATFASGTFDRSAARGSSGRAANSPHKSGSVIGTFRLIDGPANESIPARGTVVFAPITRESAKSITLTVTSTGRFETRIPTGQWRVTASSPQFASNELNACGALHSLTATGGKTAHVAVVCEVP